LSNVDENLIKRKIIDIKQFCGEIEENLSKGVGAFLSDGNLRDAVKYRFIAALEAAFSICNHISVRIGEIPKSYSNCFHILSDHNIIDEKLADEMSEIAKFRNILVHLYWDISDKQIFEKIKSYTPIFSSFIRKVKNYVEKAGDN